MSLTSIKGFTGWLSIAWCFNNLAPSQFIQPLSDKIQGLLQDFSRALSLFFKDSDIDMFNSNLHILNALFLMPSWTFGLRCVYGGRIQPVFPFSCGRHAEAGGNSEIFVWIHGLRSLYNFV